MREKAENTSDNSDKLPLKRNKPIYIAIAIIILLTVVAMTGVYYEYW